MKGTATTTPLVPLNDRRAAGIDIGATFHVAAVPADLDPQPVRSFRSFTRDLNALADWLVKVGVNTVAMESTGIYWVATIRDALTGNYRPEHVFALRQALELYDFYQSKLSDCDGEIENVLRELPKRTTTPAPPQRRQKGKNEPQFDIRAIMNSLLGVDLTEIHGLGPYTILRIFAECGSDNDPMAHRQALHLLAHLGARQQDIRRQGLELEDPSLGEPSGRLCQ